MKNVWKWILGILLALMLFGLALIPLFFRIGYRYMPMMRGGFRGDFHSPGVFGFMGGFMALWMILLPLLVIAILVLIGFWIGSARRNSAQAASPTNRCRSRNLPSTRRLTVSRKGSIAPIVARSFSRIGHIVHLAGRKWNSTLGNLKADVRMNVRFLFEFA